jgi:Lactate dehydrogenase and related dehydrogenases
MKIVILDGYTLNPGDLSWENMKNLGDCIIYDRTSPDEIISRAKDVEILITNKIVLTEAIMDNLPHLKYIGVLATGYNVVDVEAATKKGIVVTNIPAYSTNSVAQQAFALLLTITNQVEYHSQEVKKGRWSACSDFAFWDKPLIELAGLTLGIIGFGHIGIQVARIAQAMGMNVITSSSKTQYELPEGVKKVDADTLFTISDVISLHSPLTPETNLMINQKRLAQMKKTSILINTARGGLIDEAALAKALNEESIYAAGVDVLSTEPPAKDNPLLSAKNCYISPHVAWATLAARKRLMDIAVANVEAFIDGKALNRVNKG